MDHSKHFRIYTCIASLSFLFLASCASTKMPGFEVPAIEISPVTIESLDFDNVRLKTAITSTEPVDRKAHVRTNNLYLVIASDTVYRHESPQVPYDLESGGTISEPVHIDLSFNDLLRRFGSFGDLETIPLRFSATVDVAANSDEESEPVRAVATSEAEFPALMRPEVHIDTLMLNSFNLANAELELRMRIVNPGAYPVYLTGTEFEVIVDDTRWHSQQLNRRVEVPIRSDIVLTFTFSMRPRDFGTDVYRKLNMSQEFEYHVVGTVNFVAEVPDFTVSGTNRFRLNGQQQFERLSN